jgi:quinol monooxygenase YgiN
MNFPEISNNNSTVINILLPKPEDRDRVVELLQKGMKETIEHQPGFISAIIHQSLDSNHVLVYAQWKNAESLQQAAKLIEEGKAPAMMEVFTLGNSEYHPYEIVSVHRHS